MMVEENTSRVVGWLTKWLGWIGGQSHDLAGEGVSWARALSTWGIIIAGAVALLWIMFALWYTSRRP